MILKQYRVDYDGKKCNDGHWYVRHEICDKCKKTIYDESVLHSKKEEDKISFCSECIRELMDKDISYQDAVKIYGRNTN